MCVFMSMLCFSGSFLFVKFFKSMNHLVHKYTLSGMFMLYLSLVSNRVIFCGCTVRSNLIYNSCRKPFERILILGC